MASWVQQILEANPELAAFPVVKRARRSLHLRRPDGKILGLFTGAPCHYQDEHDEWQPLGTTPLYDTRRGLWHCPGLSVIVTNTGEVHLGNYSQHTRRIGLLRPSTMELLAVRDIPLGSKEGDVFIAERDEWRIERRITETGYRELLTLKARPDIPVAQAGDFLVLETLISGISLPNGWIEGQYSISTRWSPIPMAWDANNKPLVCRRYWRDGMLYTGIPATELAHAIYPITIDPDFAGSTADGYTRGFGTSYATSRNTSSEYDSTGSTLPIGQVYDGTWYSTFRSHLKFDTSALPDAAVITQVNLSLVCTIDYSTVDFDIQIVKQDWSAQDPLSDANREAAYDNCLAGTADDSIWRNTNGMSINTQYTSGNLSLAWPSKTGDTYYSLRSNRDFDGTAPTKTNLEYIHIASQENATAAYRPVLTILYEQEFQQSVAGVLTLGGMILKRIRLPGEGTIFFTGISTRAMKFARTIFSGVSTFIGTVKGKDKKALLGFSTLAGAATKKVSITRIGSFLSSSQLINKAMKILAGIFASTGISLRTMIFVRAMSSGALTLTGAVTKRMTLTRTMFAGVLTYVGVLKRRVLRVILSGLIPTGTVVRTTTISLVGTLTLIGTMLKKTSKLFTGFVPFKGTSARIMRFARTIFAGVLSLVGVATSERPEKIGFITITETLLYTVTISELGDE